MLVPTLKRFVAVAGTFATVFPNTSDPDLDGMLADGFGEASMYGFFPHFDIDVDTFEVTPDLGTGEGSLVVLFAATRMIQAELRNRKSHTHYIAGPVSAEVDYAASALTELLKEYQAEKQAIVALAATSGASDAFFMCDLALARAIGDYGNVPFSLPTGLAVVDPLGGML